MNTAIWWIRRDLRLADNPALAMALERADAVIPLFILDPKLLVSPYSSERRVKFLFEGLGAMSADLKKRGSTLVLRQGDPLSVLQQVRDETNVHAIYAEADVSPYARRRDERVRRQLPLTLVSGLTVHPVDILQKPDGTPYTVFTPFSRMWRGLPFPGKPLPAPERLAALPALSSLVLPETSAMTLNGFPAGEAEAQQRLAAFTDFTVYRYAEDRNRMDLDGTSSLSPYLRFGMLSARQAAWAARQAIEHAPGSLARQGAETWLNELVWREFYLAILYYFPYVRRMAFRPELRQVPWQSDPAGLAAWRAGRTGYPVVDAAMRQLNATGWMHNRARMIVASFLTKDLLIDWREGERYFMQQLLDGDPAANNGGWQWTAGTGTDAAPYFRVFNPILQGKKFDPQGAYVRRWAPELANVPDAYIHAPWEMPEDVQRNVGCRIGVHYPAPIIDHALARQRVLVAYRQGA